MCPMVSIGPLVPTLNFAQNTTYVSADPLERKYNSQGKKKYRSFDVMSKERRGRKYKDAVTP